MPKLHKRIEIDASVKKVFEYVEDPKNHPEFMTNMVEVKNLTGAGKGTHYNWTWKMAGVKLNGESTYLEDIPEKRIVLNSKGGIESTWTLNFEPHENATILDLDIDYTIPVPVLGKIAEKMLLKRNEREADLNLVNLKERLES